MGSRIHCTKAPRSSGPIATSASRAATGRLASFSPRDGLDGVVDLLLFAQHAVEMFRRSVLSRSAEQKNGPKLKRALAVKP